MIPIRDTVQSRHYPVITMGLIGVNVFIYIIQIAQGPDFHEFVFTYGLVPARYTVDEVARHFTTGQQLIALVSFMFLHGGFLHILGNMWILYIFGDNVEDFLGSFKYLLFYLAGGFFSGMAHMVLNIQSTIPVIGASGAVAAIMGAYFILYPRSRILTLIPIVFIPIFLELPAYIFLGIWFLLQVLNAAGTVGMDAPGIAWWAHIGGFVFGVVIIIMVQTLSKGTPKTITKRWDGFERRKTQHLQVIRPSRGGERELDLKGTIHVTPYEADAGTVKTVNIPSGFQKRLYRVRIPPGIQDGNTMRLKDLGRQDQEGHTGDLYLEVRVDQSH